MADEKDFLDDMIEPIEAPEQVAPEPEVTTPQAEPVADRDDKGRFAKKGEEGVPPAPEKVAFEGAATLDERRRRQEAEQRAEALEKQLQAYQSPAPSIWEDEQGAFQHNNQQVVNEASIHSRVMMSEMLAARDNKDFAEVKETYLAMERDNPALGQQVMADPDPWRKAVQIVRNHQSMQELGAVNVADLEAKIEQRLRAEMGTAPAALPQSLADTQSARGGTNAPLGPLTLKELLG